MKTDILIIGSGPVGATFARLISDAKPDIKILMVDLGPKLTKKAGQHLKNIENEQDREKAQIQSQGHHQKPYPLVTVPERAAAIQKGNLSLELLARAGTHLISENYEDLLENQMPAASLSSNIGGMGAHWTCACPRPDIEEQIPFISTEDQEIAFIKAEKLLSVSQNIFPETAESLAIQRLLGNIVNQNQPESRFAQKMPLACKIGEKGEPYWVGVDTILGEIANENYKGNVEIRSETMCRKLLISERGNRILGAMVEHLPSQKIEIIYAKMVIVAADAYRTPQLLWASNIRPKALGHYLNEHPFIFTAIELKEELVNQNESEIKYESSQRKEPTIGVFWAPFSKAHPHHGQVMHMALSPIKTTINEGPKHIVGLGWGCRKEMKFEDFIGFLDSETDWLGMPKMKLHFSYSEKDKLLIDKTKNMQAKIATSFGKIVKEGEQTLMPAGSSLHTQGTVRMGETNDGTSVCDTYSQVWDFENLFLGGNGVVPTPLSCNITLTSVALAIRSAEKIIEGL